MLSREIVDLTVTLMAKVVMPGTRRARDFSFIRFPVAVGLRSYDQGELPVVAVLPMGDGVVGCPPALGEGVPVLWDGKAFYSPASSDRVESWAARLATDLAGTPFGRFTIIRKVVHNRAGFGGKILEFPHHSEADVIATAASVVLQDGLLWSECGEPRWTVELRNRVAPAAPTVTNDFESRWHPTDESEFANHEDFRLDRLEDAIAFADTEVNPVRRPIWISTDFPYGLQPAAYQIRARAQSAVLRLRNNLGGEATDVVRAWADVKDALAGLENDGMAPLAAAAERLAEGAARNETAFVDHAFLASSVARWKTEECPEITALPSPC